MDLVRESLGITIVFALLWAALWLLKRKGALKFGRSAQQPGAEPLEVLDRVRLTPQHSVQVVRVRDQEIVLGLHASGFTVLVPARLAIEYELGAKTQAANSGQ